MRCASAASPLPAVTSAASAAVKPPAAAKRPSVWSQWTARSPARASRSASAATRSRGVDQKDAATRVRAALIARHRA